MATQKIVIDKTPTKLGDGTKDIFISSEGFFMFGFGDDTTPPEAWHIFNPKKLDAINISASFGQLWVRATNRPIELIYSIGG